MSRFSFLCVAALAFGRAGAAESLTFTHRAMATEFSFTLIHPPGFSDEDLGRIAAEAFDRIDEIEGQISSWIPESETSAVNRRASREPVHVTRAWWGLFTAALDAHRKTGGAFDVTVGPLLDAYRLQDRDDTGSPDLARVLKRVGMQYLHHDPEAHTIRFAMEGMRIDFGGIGKGHALDEACELLRRRGIQRGLLDAGRSTSLVLGPPNGRPTWTVNIRHPYNPEEVFDTVPLATGAISTSGCYGDLKTVDGTPVCDIIDPRTGEPVHRTVSATALARTAAEADALSTAFLVMEHGEIRALCETEGVRAVLLPAAPPGELLQPIRIFPDQR